jgi:hypothetical protein
MKKESQSRIADTFNALFEYESSTSWDVVYPSKILQDDGNNCGVFICYYLECALKKCDFQQPFDTTEFRNHMLDIISGKCDIWSSAKSKTDVCKVCGKKSPAVGMSKEKTIQWVSCDRCERWAHTVCAGVDEENLHGNGSTYSCK